MKTNVTIISGNLTRDPELATSGKGVTYCKFGIAHNHSKEKVSFFDVTAFGTTAENVGKYLAKGAAVIVTGHLEQSSWDDRDTGAKRSRVVINASNVEFGAKGGDTASPQAERPASRPNPQPARETPASPAYGESFDGGPDEGATDDDLPF